MVQERYREALSEQAVKAIVEAAGSNLSIRKIAAHAGVSHPSVLRVWRRNGIDREALAARNKLVDEHRWLAERIAVSVAREVPPQMRAELPGVATVALIEAAGQYDPSRGVAFTLYAQQRIRGACLDSVRRRHWKNGTAGEYSRDVSEARQDTGQSAERSAVDASVKAQVMEAIGHLPGRHAVLIYLHYIEERTLESIAPRLGVGASRLSQLHREGLEILRARMKA